MRERSRATISELRATITCLPRATRIAMLEGITRNDIIVGAYTHEDGICPMLAAHRAGGRTNFISFAKAWDRFAFRSTAPGKARRATERELLILRTHLEASLLEDDPLLPNPFAGIDVRANILRQHWTGEFFRDSQGRMWYGTAPNNKVGYFYLAGKSGSARCVATPCSAPRHTPGRRSILRAARSPKASNRSLRRAATARSTKWSMGSPAPRPRSA